MSLSEQPIVSVVIPAYNCATSIRRCIASILSADHYDVEVIVVDDGSTDETADIVKYEAAHDSRIVYLRQENQGSSAARNTGIEYANGKILMFVDSDDEIDCTALDILAKFISSYAGDVISLSYELIDGSEVERHRPPVDIDRRSIRCIGTGNDAIKLVYSGELENYSWSYAYKAEFIKNYRFRPEFRILEDAVFIHEVLPEAESVWIVNGPPLYRYYMNDKSLVHVHDNNKAINAFNAIALIGEDVDVPDSYLNKLALFAASIVDYCSSDWKRVYQLIRHYMINNLDLGSLSLRDKLRALLVLGNLYPQIMLAKKRLSR